MSTYPSFYVTQLTDMWSDPELHHRLHQLPRIVPRQDLPQLRPHPLPRHSHQADSVVSYGRERACIVAVGPRTDAAVETEVAQDPEEVLPDAGRGVADKRHPPR